MARVLVALLFVPAAFAQSSAGGATIQGTVKDPTGAVIPNAKLTVIHVDTGRVTRAESNPGGNYTTPPLAIGKYTIRVEAPGMKAWLSEIVLETGRVAEIDPILVPGPVSETVRITDAAPLVTTTEPTDASILDVSVSRRSP
jgi:carboxypeptidase family protein